MQTIDKGRIVDGEDGEEIGDGRKSVASRKGSKGEA